MQSLEHHLQKFRKRSLLEVSVSNPNISLGTDPSYKCRHNCVALQEETIFSQDFPIWRIFYLSRFLNGIEQYPEFSQRVLGLILDIQKNHPKLKKPAYLHFKEFEYVNAFHGTISKFHGIEHIIFDKETLVFKQSYHGGLYAPTAISLVC